MPLFQFWNNDGRIKRIALNYSNFHINGLVFRVGDGDVLGKLCKTPNSSDASASEAIHSIKKINKLWIAASLRSSHQARLCRGSLALALALAPTDESTQDPTQQIASHTARFTLDDLLHQAVVMAAAWA